jgi:MSHA biogenesis protein MshP
MSTLRHHGIGATPRARGFGLVPALFLIVILALLAAVGIRVASGQQQTVTLALQGARGLAAARAGIDWGAYTALHGKCGNSSLALNEGALQGFVIAVTCSATSFDEDGKTWESYVVDATATAGKYGSPDYVSRHIRTSFTNAN